MGRGYDVVQGLFHNNPAWGGAWVKDHVVYVGWVSGSPVPVTPIEHKDLDGFTVLFDPVAVPSRQVIEAALVDVREHRVGSLVGHRHGCDVLDLNPMS